jgi:hypothetical protein
MMPTPHHQAPHAVYSQEADLKPNTLWRLNNMDNHFTGWDRKIVFRERGRTWICYSWDKFKMWMGGYSKITLTLFELDLYEWYSLNPLQRKGRKILRLGRQASGRCLAAGPSVLPNPCHSMHSVHPWVLDPLWCSV